jgi:peptidoglycan/xylan/chitin deacetylase (PgdA/CDA1 family)
VKLVVPYSGELNAADARLVRLAGFLGGQCELLRVEKGVTLSLEFIERHVGDKNSCFVVNPAAIRECLPRESFPTDLATYLTSQFSFVLIHNLSSDPFAAGVINTFSKGSLGPLQPVEGSSLSYGISAAHRHVCGAFSGLTFGPVNQANDRVFAGNPAAGIVQPHITIGGRPFFASAQRERAEVFFLAGVSVADLSANVGGQPLTEYFSQLIPPAMFIRYAFRQECWHPNRRHATLIIDDPLLRKDYGFLNYERLLALMDKYNFHTSIAFIPHNCRRNSPGITRMFKERPDRLSICFHGNDHTAAEFASKDSGLLNAMLTVAEERMDVHQKETGIVCDHVMVFPQGNFSRDAMAALKAHNFSASVNSGPYPFGENPGLTLAEFMEPAVLKYGGFPLFLRKYPQEIALQDIAFDLFFGKPVLIVEHHQIFKDPESLTQLVSRINALAPEIRWSNLQTAVENSYLRRWMPDGTLEIQAYANEGKIENASESLLGCSVEWPGCSEIPVERVLLDGMPWHDAPTDDKGIRLSFDVPPGGSREFSVVYQNNFGLSDANRRVPWKTKAFFRRRLSELRDNHLSKSPGLLAVAKALQRTLLKGSTS